MPHLAVVIVSWNVRGLLTACLRSLLADLASAQVEAEVWVVDNASSDGTPQMVAEAARAFAARCDERLEPLASQGWPVERIVEGLARSAEADLGRAALRYLGPRAGRATLRVLTAALEHDDRKEAAALALLVVESVRQSVLAYGGSRGGLLLDLVAAQPLSLGLSALLLLVGLTYVVGPDMYSRMFCARDGRTARKSALWTALIIIPVALAITLIGTGGAALFPEVSATEQVLPAVIVQLLPPFLSGIVLAALLSAMMSSADTTLLSASTILSVDVIGQFKPSLSRDKLVLISRWSIVLLGLASLVLALALGGIISALLFAYTIYTGGVILPVLFGFYRDRLKVTPAGALAAIIGGGAAALASKIFDIIYLDLGALLLSGLLLFAVSLIDNRLRKGRLDVKEGI